MFSLIAWLIVIALVIAAVYCCWVEISSKLTARRIEQQTAQAEARAAEMRAQADLAREHAARAQAEAAVAKAEGEADALRTEAQAAAEVINAGATAINRQSFLVLMWGILTPAGLVITGIALCLGGIVGGIAITMTVKAAGKTEVGKDTGQFVQAYLRKKGRKVYRK